VGASVPLVPGEAYQPKATIHRLHYVFGGGSRTAATTLSARSGNKPQPPPPKLRAPEGKSGTPSAEQALKMNQMN